MIVEQSDFNSQDFSIELTIDEFSRLNTMAKFRQAMPAEVLKDILASILSLFEPS